MNTKRLRPLLILAALPLVACGTDMQSLLSEEEEGWHSELALLDANLLFAQAAVLVELREKRRVGKLIREIARRFVGMETMLVEYPIGEQSTLTHALTDLRDLRHNI